MRASLLIYFFMATVWSVHGQRRDTFHVYFALNDATLSKKATTYMDSLVTAKVLVRGRKFTVLGYADYLGSNAYNDTLSFRRARKVTDYLVSKGINEADLELCVGKGKVERTVIKGTHGYAADRNVQIITGWIKAKEKSYDSTFAIDVATIPVNSTFPLNILFEDARSVILKESNPELRKLYNFLKKNPTLVIRLEGHICCLDPKERKQDGMDFDNGGPLSKTRAKAIYDYLVQYGISRDRLSYIGLANASPWVTPEVTEEDRKQNRRVEVRIISK